MLFWLFGGNGSRQADDVGFLGLPEIVMIVFGLGMILPSISVQVRRLHDRDLSGWWYLATIVAVLIPVVGLLALIALFVMNVLRGTPGTNRFGRDPLGVDTSADVFS